MRRASLTYAHCRPPTSTRTTSLSQPRNAHVSARTTTLVNQCSADLMSRSYVHIAESFSIRLSELLHDAPPDSDVNTHWQLIAHSLHTAAGEKIGYRRQQKSTWFNHEFRQAAIEKNDAYQVTLKSAATRAVYEKDREKRRE